MNNSLNNIWNDLHLGYRVPIDNVGAEDAPFTLGSSVSEWKEGSINNAIYNTVIKNEVGIDPTEESRFARGELDFISLLKYINKDMLYGVNEDSRNTLPGNFTALRGYPTATVFHELTTISNYSNVLVNYNGTSSISGDYTVFKYNLNTRYKMPYPLIFTLNITVEGSLVLGDIVFKVDPGFNNITHYKNNTEDSVSGGELVENWRVLTDGFFISVDTSELSGDLNISITLNTFNQSPFYGTLDPLSQTVAEVDYNPSTPNPSTAIGPSPYKGVPREGSLDLSTIELYLERVSKCNEFISEEMYPRLQRNGRLYLPNGETLQVGSKLYSDPEGLIDAIREPEDVGAYLWVGSAYYSGPTYGSIWDITRYLILDENSIVTYLDIPSTGYLGSKCWIQAWKP